MLTGFLCGNQVKKEVPTTAEMFAAIPEISKDKDVATRESGSQIINYISDLVPQFLSGSADLHGSNKNYIKTGGNFGKGFDKSYTGLCVSTVSTHVCS